MLNVARIGPVVNPVERWRDMFRIKAGLGWVALAGWLVLGGCKPGPKDITEGITPQALNFYVLMHEIQGLRTKVGEAPADRVDQHLPTYRQLAARCQRMAAENQAAPELKKYPAVASAMDSCLAAGFDFLSLEEKAVALYGQLDEVSRQLEDLRASVRNNSILAKKQKPKIDALDARQSALQRDLEPARNRLARASQLASRLLKNYNRIIKEAKILDYGNDEAMFALLGWQKPTAAPKTKRR